jgi:hypothetical protein
LYEYVCLFHAFRFYFFKYLSLLIVSPLLLHSYPFLTWPHFSCHSVLSLIPFYPHLLSPIFVLNLFCLILFLLSMSYEQRETYFLNVSEIYVYFTYIIDIMIIITVSCSLISCFIPAVYRLIKCPHNFSILILPSNDFSVYITHKLNHFALGEAGFM